MALYNNPSNTPRQHQEAATVLSTHEMVAGRISTLINTRERVHVALPLAETPQPAVGQVQSAAEHASKVLQQSAQIEQIQNDAPTAQVYQFPARSENALEAARRATKEAFDPDEPPKDAA